jgi:hypothetical protein
MKPRIYLIQSNNTLVYQNIAIRYNLGFINLNNYKLKDCKSIAKKNKKRDIIVCNYNQSE